MKHVQASMAEAANVEDRGRSRSLKVLFIRNPYAGRGLQGFTRRLARHLSPESVRYEVAFTNRAGDAEHLARSAAGAGFDIVVAVGGDGTVNEVGRGLLGARTTALAIIPTGSGNGFARHMGVPLSVSGALRRLNAPTFRRTDVGLINGHPFFCTAGLGFDAHVSKSFAHSKQRGLMTYIRLALREYQSFRGAPIELRYEGHSSRSNCYVLAFANAAQYGNNAYIAPFADVADGLLDLCLIEDMPLRRALRVAFGLAFGDLPKSRAATYSKASEICVRLQEPIGFHADGDYLGEADRFDVRIAPGAITVCT